MRAEQRDYWHAPRAATGAGVDREDLSLVAVAPSVIRNLNRQLHSPARLRGGLLFGQQQGETLHVSLATTLGRSAWYGQSRWAALDVDARFTLGWSEAVQDILGGSTDWVGNWLMYGNSQLHSGRKDQRWFRSGQRLGLFDETHVLMIAGWEEGRVTCRVYRQDADGQAEELTVNLKGSDLIEKIKPNLDLPASPLGDA